MQVILIAMISEFSQWFQANAYTCPALIKACDVLSSVFITFIWRTDQQDFKIFTVFKIFLYFYCTRSGRTVSFVFYFYCYLKLVIFWQLPKLRMPYDMLMMLFWRWKMANEVKTKLRSSSFSPTAELKTLKTLFKPLTNFTILPTL